MASVSALTTVALCGGELPSWFVIILLVASVVAFVASVVPFLSFLFNFISKFSESDKK